MKEMNIVEYLFIIVCLNHRIGAATLDCNFDKDFCEWRQDDSVDFNWERERGETRSSSTGPSSDHTTGSGHYIYIEASSKENGDKSRIISPIQLPGQYCLKFWYSMYGSEIGSLHVYLVLKNYGSIIFNSNKNLGNRSWRKSVLNIKTDESYQIVFEGVIGDGSKGDIAIDDISVKSSLCSIDCDFEVDLCNWMQYNDDDFDWNRRGNIKFLISEIKNHKETIDKKIQYLQSLQYRKLK